jgi:hypothetical protein
MMKTNKIYIDYTITIISSSGFYVSKTSVSIMFTSIIHINFNGEHDIDWNEVDGAARWRFPRARRRGSVSTISGSSLERRGNGGAEGSWWHVSWRWFLGGMARRSAIEVEAQQGWIHRRSFVEVEVVEREPNAIDRGGAPCLLRSMNDDGEGWTHDGGSGGPGGGRAGGGGAQQLAAQQNGSETLMGWRFK